MRFLRAQNNIYRKRAMLYVTCGLLLILADVLFWVRVAWAAPAYTPYANSIVAQSGLGSGSANNAVGAPDGQSALLLGVNSSLTLDMGDGEEGTNALKVYLSPVIAQIQMEVQFLDDDQAIISMESRQVFLNLADSTETFQYDWHTSGKAYRFIRISVLAAASLGVDSIEALGFIGSSPTQDTDGDGVPDREDSDPLVPKAPSTPVANNGSNNSSNTTTVIRTLTSTNSGTTPPVNNPPAASNDKDGDQMDDAWELANKLDPNNKNDATEDPDKDKLINLKEYQFDTDPHKADTDNDGMPDGWEVENGLNAKADDAEQDPDGDYITNLGEYHFDANPYRADDITDLVAKLHRTERWWSWVVFGLLLALAVLAFWRARKLVVAAKGGHHRRSKKSETRSSLPPL